MFNRISLLGSLVVGLVLAAATASAEFKLERKMTLEPGGSFTLNTEIGSVLIVGDSPTGAQLTLTSTIDDFDRQFELTFDGDSRAVRVGVKHRGGSWTTFLGGLRRGSAQFTIHVPRTTAVGVDTSGGQVEASMLTGALQIRSSGGGLAVKDVEGQVNADTSGGSIQVQRVRGHVRVHTSGGGVTIADVQGNVSADTSGGSIEIDSATGDVDAETSGGGVRIRGAGGRVQASSSGGPVSAGFAAGNSKGGSLSSSGGGVRAEVDPAVKLTIDAVSSGGGANSDLPITVRGRISGDSINGDLNGGGAVLKLRSSGGGVRISGPSKSASAR